jgi:hypothetical protein
MERTLPIRTTIFLALLALLPGCKPSGPASTRTTSAKFQTLAERTAFLSQYVAFRRTYETLDFDVFYQDNGGGGGVPGPSDWDIRLVATVPAAEVAAWIPAGVKRATTPPTDTAWLKSVPTTVDPSGINEWYVDGPRTIGLDRGRRIVAYRITTTPN